MISFKSQFPYKGTYKRNHEGDYHMPEHEVNAMIRDRNPEGNDSIILEGFTMENIDFLTLQQYRQRFQVHNPEHVWNSKEDKEFLENLGGIKHLVIIREFQLTVPLMQ